MPVPSNIFAPFRRLHRLGAAALLLFLCAPVFAKPPQPVARIPLEDLGYQNFAARMLAVGNSLLTVDFVDEDHLLVTFGVRRLLKRLADDPPNDDDRTVLALLLELPSGKVLAQTEWRLHDQGRYLWPLTHGTFLLRTRDTLTAFSPLANLAAGHPFEQRNFLHTDRQIQAVLLPPEEDLLTLETSAPQPIPDDTAGLQLPAPRTTPVRITFFRLVENPQNPAQIIPASYGIAEASTPVNIPLNASGYLNVLDQGHQTWAFDFHSYTGKIYQLALLDSTCRPLPIFVSRGEFLALSCHGGNDRRQLSAFNLNGDAMWEQVIGAPFLFPYFSFSPSSGRFAISRVSTLSAAIATTDMSASELTGQSVDVYQINSGDLLLHTDCSPIARAGQNFALSPAGTSFVAIRNQVIEVYHLPPLSAKDQTAIHRAATFAPEPVLVPVVLTALAPGQSPDDSDSTPSPAEPPSTAVTTPAPTTSPVSASASTPVPTQTSNSAPAAQSPSSQPPADSPEPDAPRKPPTLYAPGEKPDSKPQ
jgi:hypothetical protein